MPRDWPDPLEPLPSASARVLLTVEAIGLAACMMLAGGVAVISAWSTAAHGGAALVAGCRATDGDTIRCGRERIRLLGIDAPELPAHCRRRRDCAPGDPYASRASLAAGLRGAVTIERVGRDRYGRTLALVRGAGGDLSCRQVRGGYARYVARWDDGERLRQQCPTAPSSKRSRSHV